MGKIEGMLKSEILRLAKRETKKAFVPLRKELRVLKGTFSQLRKMVDDLQHLVARQTKEAEAEKAEMAVPVAPAKGTKFPPRLIRALRKRLGLTQRQLARLANVTVGAVYQWESGKFEPREDKKTFLAGLRKMKKSEVKQMLGAKTPQPQSKKRDQESQPSSPERKPSRSVRIRKNKRQKG